MTDSSSPQVRVGVAAIIANPLGTTTDRILIGRRKGSHGAGTWQLPGGHLEYGEEVAECAARETLEETGLAVKAGPIVAVSNDIFAAEGKHYITLFVYCEPLDPQAEPKIMEPEKCDCWEWRRWAELGDLRGDESRLGVNIFQPLDNLLLRKPDFRDLRPDQGSSL